MPEGKAKQAMAVGVAWVAQEYSMLLAQQFSKTLPYNISMDYVADNQVLYHNL